MSDELLQALELVTVSELAAAMHARNCEPHHERWPANARRHCANGAGARRYEFEARKLLETIVRERSGSTLRESRSSDASEEGSTSAPLSSRSSGRSSSSSRAVRTQRTEPPSGMIPSAPVNSKKKGVSQ